MMSSVQREHAREYAHRRRKLPWPCVYCDHVSYTEPESKRHRSSHPIEERVAVCPYCDRAFRNCGQAYVRHLNGHETAEERFWAKVDKDGPNGCWLYLGALQGKGYGLISVVAKDVKAHRFAYESVVGPIPDGLSLDHLCRNPQCVNPAHLEPVTHLENVRRGDVLKLTPCPFCGLKANRGNLTRHMRSKHPSRPLQVAPEGDDA